MKNGFLVWMEQIDIGSIEVFAPVDLSDAQVAGNHIPYSGKRVTVRSPPGGTIIGPTYPEFSPPAFA
ncbi:hypothetical protein J3459_006729 [Metarhizium acridum]|uniref:uncharacterized protein n=1 Tax=Metarhizium acridum TaxID=92637 RepID=UPI001C6CBD02|nr:hypothetical protein J3458_000802 [Metarhizium acridum]KAG8427392.1 hypothetical protein J3459_006729 [Metarhizium acridum]